MMSKRVKERSFCTTNYHGNCLGSLTEDDSPAGVAFDTPLPGAENFHTGIESEILLSIKPLLYQLGHPKRAIEHIHAGCFVFCDTVLRASGLFMMTSVTDLFDAGTGGWTDLTLKWGCLSNAQDTCLPFVHCPNRATLHICI